MAIQTYPFDAAKHIDEQGEVEILADAASTGDERYIRLTLNTVARSRGFTQIAREAGITRDALFDAYLAEDGSGTDVLLRVFRALGVAVPDETASAAE